MSPHDPEALSRLRGFLEVTRVVRSEEELGGLLASIAKSISELARLRDRRRPPAPARLGRLRGHDRPRRPEACAGSWATRASGRLGAAAATTGSCRGAYLCRTAPSTGRPRARVVRPAARRGRRSRQLAPARCALRAASPPRRPPRRHPLGRRAGERPDPHRRGARRPRGHGRPRRDRGAEHPGGRAGGRATGRRSSSCSQVSSRLTETFAIDEILAVGLRRHPHGARLRATSASTCPTRTPASSAPAPPTAGTSTTRRSRPR